MKIPTPKVVACLFLLCHISVSMAKDEDKAPKLSLEFLEFIGDFTDQKNRWQDPIETAEMQKQKEKSDKESQERKQ